MKFSRPPRLSITWLPHTPRSAIDRYERVATPRPWRLRSTRRARPGGGSHLCLRCFAPLPPEKRQLQRCARCGFLNTPVLDAAYWNRRPFLLRLECCLKVGAFVLFLPLAALLAEAFGASAGNFVVAGVVCIGLWLTATKLTRHSLFPATVFWCGLATVLAFVATGEDWRLSAGFGGAAFVTLLLGLLFARWKRRLLAGGTDTGRVTASS